MEECGYTAHYIVFWGTRFKIYLGDLLNYMESRWGEGYAQILDATGFSYSTVANAKSVTGRVPKHVRPEEGTYFSHLDAVAALPEPKQKTLLEKAAKKGWTTADLKLEVKKEKRKAEKLILPETVKIELHLSFYAPENMVDKLRQLARSWASRLKVHDMELIDDVQVKRLT